jgi:hypothetical protein
LLGLSRDLSVPERILLFCIASGTECAQAGVTGNLDGVFALR